MKILIKMSEEASDELGGVAHDLICQLTELGIAASITHKSMPGTIYDGVCVELVSADLRQPSNPYRVAIGSPETPLEQTLRAIPFNFDMLPLLVEGDSKIIRLLTDQVVVTRFKPTVYSFTMNRYGEAKGTDDIRAKFTAALFREMARVKSNTDCKLLSAFLAEIPSNEGSLLMERKVETCNLEVRVKRYHIGSPIHRYRFTERYPSTQRCGPLKRWSRLDEPVVCFDWRHPLSDENGNRLADEPISDDYARMWMYNVNQAKELARQTFLWMEEFFREVGVLLVDMCLFIDRQGKVIYGEISPDCMRVRFTLNDPAGADAAAKDVWRVGGSPEDLRKNYEEFYQRLFRPIQEKSAVTSDSR